MSWGGTEGAQAGNRGRGPWAVVGIGNPQRQDDGLGPWVARALARHLGPLEGVRCLSRLELAPELIDELMGAKRLVLVDATTERLPGRGVRWRRLIPDPAARSPFSHALGPGLLLGLWAELYAWHPRAHVVAIRGERFGLGRGLSAPAITRARLALRQLTGLLQEED